MLVALGGRFGSELWMVALDGSSGSLSFNIDDQQ